jgi:sugar/nucleoside kinase (ribokinase family)
VEHVIYEPISKEKSKRILHADSICKITILKPNLIQLKDLAESLNPEFATFNTSINSFEENESHIKQMISELFAYSDKMSTVNGTENRFSLIVVTLGKHGVLVASKKDKEFKYYPAPELDDKLIKSAVGSGDSFMGGFIYGLYQGADFDTSVNYGQKCAIKSLQSERNISESISESIL